MNNAQQAVMDFNAENNLRMEAHVRILDLQSELGELAKEHLKITDYGGSNFTKIPEWKEEMGDIFYSLLSLANETEVDLEDALGGALKKYAKRIELDKNPGSAKP